MPSDLYDDFLPAVARRAPAIAPLIQEHLEDNDGEMLPSLLMFDLQQWAIETVATDEAAVRALLAGLTEAWGSGDEDVKACIMGDFLDGLPPSGEEGAEIRRLLPSDLAQALIDVER